MACIQRCTGLRWLCWRNHYLCSFLHCACEDFEFNINNSKSQRSQDSNYVSIVLPASMLEDMSCRVLFLSCSLSASCGMLCSSFCVVPFCSVSTPPLFESFVLFLASCFSLSTVMSCWWFFPSCFSVSTWMALTCLQGELASYDGVGFSSIVSGSFSGTICVLAPLVVSPWLPSSCSCVVF